MKQKTETEETGAPKDIQAIPLSFALGCCGGIRFFYCCSTFFSKEKGPAERKEWLFIIRLAASKTQDVCLLCGSKDIFLYTFYPWPSSSTWHCCWSWRRSNNFSSETNWVGDELNNLHIHAKLSHRNCSSGAAARSAGWLAGSRRKGLPIEEGVGVMLL